MTKCKDCNKRAIFAKPNESAIYCGTHKKQGMINVYKKICNEADCEKYAIDGDKKIDMEDKLEKLLDTIEEQVGRIENEENEELLEIIKLY